ncbi:MAG: MurR/RpiR family transcriptional regulator [Acidobacteria bacterium]|nr:MurR/RpiR family transcriptional regulator [Acidobacteriota bacterium]
MPWIRGLLPTLNGVQRQIGETVLKDPERFISLRISESAGLCNASKSSIVIFCKSMGLSGLSAFKLSLARELAAPVFPLLSDKAEGQPSKSEIVQWVFEELQDHLRQTIKLNTLEAISSAAEMLLKARRIVLFGAGLSLPIAYFFQGRLNLIGLPAVIQIDTHLQLVASAQMKKSDVAVGISSSGKSRATIECLMMSKSRGARTICITDSIGSPLDKVADLSLYAAPGNVTFIQAPMASRTGQLALVDALLAILTLQRKRESLSQLRAHEECLLSQRISDLRSLQRARRKTGKGQKLFGSVETLPKW